MTGETPVEAASHRPVEEYRKAVRILAMGLLILLLFVVLEIKAGLPREEVVKSGIAFMVILLTDVLRSGVRKEKADRLWIMALGTHLIDRLTSVVTPAASNPGRNEGHIADQGSAPPGKESPGSAIGSEPMLPAAHDESRAAPATVTPQKPLPEVDAKAPAEPTHKPSQGDAAQSDPANTEFSDKGDRYGKWVRRSGHWEREN